jgi:hypothetical protein
MHVWIVCSCRVYGILRVLAFWHNIAHYAFCKSDIMLSTWWDGSKTGWYRLLFHSPSDRFSSTMLKVVGKCSYVWYRNANEHHVYFGRHASALVLTTPFRYIFSRCILLSPIFYSSVYCCFCYSVMHGFIGPGERKVYSGKKVTEFSRRSPEFRPVRHSESKWRVA